MRAQDTLPWLLALTIATHQPVQAQQPCGGDCDGSAEVTVNELVIMVAIALDTAEISRCVAADADGDERVTVDELVAAVIHALHGCPVEVESRTLDDLFEEVAELVPGFGGMYLAEDEQVLEVYLLVPSAENVDAVADAIINIFGPIIPAGGIRARAGDYGFLELRAWYRAMLESVLSTDGVTATDINEAVNRLVIGIETAAAEPEVMLALFELGIPTEAVAIVVTGKIELLTHTVRDQHSPQQGGYQIARLINNVAGFGLVTPTLGFNATRNGVPGFVTNSHNSQVFWNLDTNAGFPSADFYQPLFSPSFRIGTESVDPQGFKCRPPYPKSYRCRYSDSLFAQYNSGVAWDPGGIAKPTAPTVLSSSIASHHLAVDHSQRFTVVAPPSQPYLVGLQLHKVGRTTGWTTGAIQYAYFPSTCADFVDAQQRVRLCQYAMTNPLLGLATFGDSGSPVFRIVDPVCGYVELYGIAWGGSQFFVPPPPWNGGSVGKMLVFSPVGGVPFQQSGIQSAADLGPLSYQAAGMCNSPTPTVVRPCSFIGPRMCGGSCPNSTDLCRPLADDSGCVCQQGPTPTPTNIPPCGFIRPRMCGGSCPNSTDLCRPLADDSGCVCQQGPTPTPTNIPPCGFIRPRMCGGSCPDSTDLCRPLADDSGCVCQDGQPTRTETPTPPTPTATAASAFTHTATPSGCGGGPLSNLVLNPSFESFSSVPTSLSQIHLASPWLSPTTGASPDYFHALAAAASSAGIPANTFGNEAAHGGNAYVGFHARPANPYREYVEGTLSTSLGAGNIYRVSFFLSLADLSDWAIDKLGAHISVGSVGPVNTGYTIAVTPQVNASSHVSNKTGWTEIVGFYTAVGGEDHIVIGNFLDNPSTPPLPGQGGPFDFAYYYLDDVSITLVESTCTPTPAPTCPGATCTPTAAPFPTNTP